MIETKNNPYANLNYHSNSQPQTNSQTKIGNTSIEDLKNIFLKNTIAKQTLHTISLILQQSNMYYLLDLSKKLPPD
jgi:hypothetical protein